MRPLACGLFAAILLIPSSRRARPNARAGPFFSPELFGDRRRTSRAKDAIFIGVMRERTPIAPQPSPEGSQVLFRGVVFGETGPDAAGGIIDQRDQLTSRASLLQPTERGATLHHQLPKTRSALAPHVDLFHPLRARAPESRFGHPLPQRL